MSYKPVASLPLHFFLLSSLRKRSYPHTVIHLPARPAGLARKNCRWRNILKDVHPFGASFCWSARLCSVFYHAKVRLVNILLQHRLQFTGVRPILIGHLDSLNQSAKSLQALVIYLLHTEIESRNKWFPFGFLREVFSD